MEEDQIREVAIDGTERYAACYTFELPRSLVYIAALHDVDGKRVIEASRLVFDYLNKTESFYQLSVEQPIDEKISEKAHALRVARKIFNNLRKFDTEDSSIYEKFKEEVNNNE